MTKIEAEFGFLVYMLDFQQVQALENSKQFEIISQIQAKLPKEFEYLDEMYYLQEADTKTEEILYAFLAGDTEKYNEQGHAYVFLTEILCAYFGQKLPNDYWYPGNYDYELYEAWESFFDLLIPLNVPENDDYTFQGLFFSKEKIANFLNVFDFVIVQKHLHQTEENPRQLALEQFKTWFEMALKEKKDLVLFIEALTQ